MPDVNSQLVVFIIFCLIITNQTVVCDISYAVNGPEFVFKIICIEARIEFGADAISK